jgi:hypothetical protein
LIVQAIQNHEGRPAILLRIREAVQAANAPKFLSVESLRYVAEDRHSSLHHLQHRHLLCAL